MSTGGESPPAAVGCGARFELPWIICHGAGWGSDEQLNQAVDERLAIDEDLVPAAGLFREQVLSYRDVLSREHAEFGALRFQVVPGFGYVTAYSTGTVLRLDRPDDRTPIDELREGLSQMTDQDIAEPEVEDITLGEAAALRRVVTRAAPELEPGAGRQGFLVVEYWVPVPGKPDLVARLVFHTSRLAFAEQLLAEFDAIAETLSVW
jgi:hypothetical protein